MTSIGGRIEIADNTQLTDISGMRSIPSNAIKNLAIYRNPLLSVCNLPNICAYLAGSGLRTIQGNRDECVSAEAIIAACDPVVPTLATGTVTSPATCGGTGSIAFTTEGLPDGDYTLNFKKDGDELQATVKVEGGKITLPGTAGVYTDFSLMYNGGSANNNSSVTLSDPTPPTLSVTAVTPPTTCSGAGSTGSISFSTTGLPDGTYNLYYNINSIISSTPVQISSGAFTLSGLTPRTLYDDFHIEYNQCIGGVPAPTYMQSPPYPEFSIETVVQPQACGGLGSIIFRTNLPDGTYPFIYRTPKGGDVPVSITAVNGTFSLSNLPADTYYLFSLNHCGEYTLNVAITLLVPATPLLSAGAATDPVTCGGTGSIDFTTAHIPDGPYTLNYTFNGSNTSANINISANTFTLGDLTAGIYAAFSVTHDDCVTEDNSSVTLSDPTPVEISVHRVYDPTVCGKEDGQINFDGYNANVDLISFTFYFKRNGKEESSTSRAHCGFLILSDLGAGEFTDFRFTDHDNCLVSLPGPVTLTAPAPPALTAGEVTNPATCGGTGSIVFSTGLPEGSYELKFLKGSEEKSATVTVNALGAFSLEDLTAGEYREFSITHNGCVSSDNSTKTLSDPTPEVLSIHFTADPGACGASDGRIQFVWTNSLVRGKTMNFKKNGVAVSASMSVLADNPVLIDLTAGTYSDFSYTDENGCQVIYTGPPVVFAEKAAPTLTAGVVTSPATCGGTGSIAFSTELPEGTYELNYLKGSEASIAVITVNAQGTFLLEDLTAGEYSGFSITHNGCVSSVPVNSGVIKLREPKPASLELDQAKNPATCGGSDGVIHLFTSSSDAPFSDMSYKKDGVLASAPRDIVGGGPILFIDGLTKGVYTDFSYTDGQGCLVTFTGPVTLTDPAAPTLSAGSVIHPAVCGGTGSIPFSTNLANGTYTLSYTKGSTPLTAEVTVLSGKFTLNNLTADRYSAFSLTVSGCTALAPNPVTLINPDATVGAITPDGPTELCEDDQVTLTATEGASYAWSSGQSTRSITVSEGGTYSVTVATYYGCQSSASITVTKKICNLPPVAVCKPLVVLVAGDDCYAVLTTQDLDGGSYDPNGDWTRHSLVGTNGIFQPGEYNVTYEVMDPKGAYSTCQTRVQVVDHTPPVARARSLTLELNASGQAAISVADVNDGSYDNCGPVTLSLNRSTFDCSDLGHLQVRLTVTDASGNVSEALADITITDNTPPVIQATDLTLALDENGRASVSKESLVTGISDNCGIWSVSVSQNEFSCEHIGKNPVTITVEDVRGNRSTATVTITVVDNTPPVVRARDITLYLDQSGKASLTSAQVDEGSKDNCGITRLSIDREQFDCNTLGEQPITLTATDAAGNTSAVTVTVIVLDTLAPVVLAKNITLDLDDSGKAILSPQDIDEGSTDNCGIATRHLQHTVFDCSQVGALSVQYTVTDATGNSTTVSIQVTIRDVTAPEALSRNAVLELDWNGKAVLAVEDVDDASTDNCGIVSRALSQTEFTCEDLGRRLVTLTLRDASGNESSARAVVEVKDPNGVCPCSYGVLAFDGITLRSNDVSAGGVGVINKNKKVRLRNTLINREDTFVKAPQSRFDNESESSTYIRGEAPQPEGFRKNTGKDKGTEKVGKGESKTLAAGKYGKVKVAASATLTLSGGDVFIRSLKVKKKGTLAFTHHTVVLARKAVRLGKNTDVNTQGEQIIIYAGGNITVGKGSEVRGYLHTQGRLKTRGGRDVTSMEGLFVADKILGGKNTHWAGGGVLCTGNNEPEPMLAKNKERRKAEPGFDKPGFDKLSLTDSTNTGLQVTLWPNPVVTRVLRVSVESESADGQMLLVDMAGNVLARKAYSGRQATHEIDMSRVPPGTYVLRVSSGDGATKALRIIKEGK